MVRKIKTTTELGELFFNHILFQKLMDKYPDRDYVYQFELMCDWWLSNKNKLPVSITAFDNWLKNTKVDESIVLKRQKLIQQENLKQEMVKKNVDPNNPINVKGRKALEEMRKRWSIKSI